MLTNSSAPMSLAELSSEVLTSRLLELRDAERLSLVEFLWYLGEMDRRRTHLDLGFSSLFVYCTDGLGYSKGCAFRRTTAARLLVRFPAASEYLAEGRLNLTTFVLLKDVLQPENHRDLLDRAAGRTEEQVEVLVASLRPRPEVKESIRRLPCRAPSPAADAGSAPKPSVNNDPVPTAQPGSGPELSLNVQPGLAGRNGSGPELRLNTPVAPAPAPRPSVKPIDAERHALKMTVGPEFMEELAQVKSALSHLVPDGNLEAILRVCFQKTLELCAGRKRGARKASQHAARSPAQAEATGTAVTEARTRASEPGPAKVRSSTTGAGRRTRMIPAEVRRAVWERDRGSCSYIGTQGRRCGSTHQLEFDHETPFALGGEATVANLRLRCRVHNQHRARAYFGDAHMAQFERRARAPDD